MGNTNTGAILINVTNINLIFTLIQLGKMSKFVVLISNSDKGYQIWQSPNILDPMKEKMHSKGCFDIFSKSGFGLGSSRPRCH